MSGELLILSLTVLLVIAISCAVLKYFQLVQKEKTFRDDKNQRLAMAFVENTEQGVWILNKDFEVEYVNKAFCDITGFNREQLLGRSFQLNFFLSAQTHHDTLLRSALAEQAFWHSEEWCQRANADKICLSIAVTKVISDEVNRRATCYVGLVSDVTYRKENDRELQRLATKDRLTGLPNRTMFNEYIQNAINGSQHQDYRFLLLNVDLIKFKKINDTLGREQGDIVLATVARRIKEEVHPDAIVARISADEFSVLIPPHLIKENAAEMAKVIAEKILNRLDTPIKLDNMNISISASMGIAIYPDHGRDFNTIVMAVDSALTYAKSKKHSNIQFYDTALLETQPDNLALESELWRGIKNNEFELYYQPKISVQNRNIIGFEALVRWNSPQRGVVSPAHFIPIAEENGMIISLSRIVIDLACQQINKWQKSGELKGRIAINISALHFQQEGCVEEILSIAKQHSVEPSCLEIEITESAMMKDANFALHQITRLRSHGFTIALDDFGTGYSSLGYLKKFPIDRLKIDRSFIRDIADSDEDRNIASAIIRLARSLQIAVIAEGVETEEQAYLLHIIGCDEMQGYLFSRPVPAGEVSELLQKSLGPAAAS